MNTLFKNTLIASVICAIALIIFFLLSVNQSITILLISVMAAVGAAISLVSALSLESDV